ncbi:MAG: hypothetical protein IJX78_06520 [Bacilli bacterium]|nr:hypothetical protein [Bacilli bacterium]
MRLKEFKEKIKVKNNQKRLKKEYQNKKTQEKELKIIGITGSRGKSTTAYIVHEYLKSLGKKSVLYSSLGIDSESSIVKKDEACEVPINSIETLDGILEEAKAYEADYLVLEVNESSIPLLKDMPIDVRVLTNFNPKHNEEHYSIEEYKNLKKAFFENVDECVCVMGLGSMMEKEDYEEFIQTNNYPKITFGSKYICEKRGVNLNKINHYLHELYDSLNGLSMQVMVNGKNYYLNTNNILPHNALNYVCAMATLDALKVLNVSKFNDCIKDLKIPGREEVLKVKGRTIVIGMFLNPSLETFKKYKQNHEINQIKVLTGSVGSGFKTWKDVYKTEKFINERKKAREFAMKEVNKYADFVYLTENDNAKEDVNQICSELQSYLTVPSKIILDRAEAIKKMINESSEGDLLFISGRGNKRVLCVSEDKVKLMKDKDVVEEYLKELGR